VYATGISNGAAMSYRLACQMADRIAAIAPIGGANQFSTLESCAPSRPVPLMHVHGAEDPAWRFEGGVGRAAWPGQDAEARGRHISVPETIAAWAALNGCQPLPQVDELPDRVEDGTRVRRERYAGCRQGAEVVLYAIEGGGHTWPDGYQYFSVERVGRTSRELNANEVMWEFFRQHRMTP
jgi:polyhydroxybutyrate depolymerase